MNQSLTGELIAALRHEKNLTQAALAEKLGVSDKAVSKWERGCGCPDVSLLPELAKVLGTNTEVLLRGEWEEKETSNGNMKNTCFYVCPKCGNLICAAEGAEVVCCGMPLIAMIPQKPDEAHTLNVSISDGDRFLTAGHPMEKDHFLSFVAFLTDETVLIRKRYPEWGLDTRLPGIQHGILLWYCIKHGLFSKRV